MLHRASTMRSPCHAVAGLHALFQVTQAMCNVQQSGEGDLATEMESALDGNSDFPDICGDAEGEAKQSGSSPYDFLALGIVSYVN